jgi:hypothetical protein
MNNKKLAILGIIAAVMLLWAVIQSQVSNNAQSASKGLSYLVSGVNVDEIDSIAVKADKDTLTFKRQADGFVVVNKDGYPAETKKINELMTDCLGIEVSQMVTDNPVNHQDLGVTEDKAKTVVTFIKPDASVLLEIIIGNTKENGQGTYIRLASSNKVYESTDIPFVDTDAANYVKKQLTALIRRDIEEVSFSSPNGKYVLKPLTDSDEVKLVDIPVGKELKQSEAKNVFTALSSLDFADVMKNPGDLKFDRQYICKLFNSTEFTFNIASKEGKTYVSCLAVFTEGRPETIKKDETPEQLKEKEGKLLLDDKADDFTKRHMGWVYEIPAYKAKYLTTELSGLLEDKIVDEKNETPDPNVILNNLQNSSNNLQND